MGYLVDSNVLIDYVAERFKTNQLKSLDLVFDEALRFQLSPKLKSLVTMANLRKKPK